VQIGADRAVVTFDRNTHKMLKYDLDGHLLYAWGTVADFPGTLWGVHGMSTDQEGNFYVAALTLPGCHDEHCRGRVRTSLPGNLGKDSLFDRVVAVEGASL